MTEAVTLIILEKKSLPKGYKALEEMGELGLEPLEFYPHAKGVRLLFKKPLNFLGVLPKDAISIQVSVKILKAILSQTNITLKKYLVVVETKKFSEILEISMEFEKINAEILEIRSLRSNTEVNYGLYTLDDKESSLKIVSEKEHSFLSATSATLKEFLGFI